MNRKPLRNSDKQYTAIENNRLPIILDSNIRHQSSQCLVRWCLICHYRLSECKQELGNRDGLNGRDRIPIENHVATVHWELPTHNIIKRTLEGGRWWEENNGR